MKRFWRDVTVEAGVISLDARPVRTPARAPLVLPNAALAEAIANEWRAVGEAVDPRAMPFTGLANAAIDRVAPDPAAFAVDLARYGATDLLCYRAEHPPELVERQAVTWDPMLAWAEARYDVHFKVTAGVVHVAQPSATVTRLSSAVEVLDAFALAGLSPLVTISGSLLIALMVKENAIDAQTAFTAAELDALWQAEVWGEDALATDNRDTRAADFAAAARFVELVRS